MRGCGSVGQYLVVYGSAALLEVVCGGVGQCGKCEKVWGSVVKFFRFRQCKKVLVCVGQYGVVLGSN